MKRSGKIFAVASVFLFLVSSPAMANVVAVAAGIAPCVEEVVDLYVKAGGEPVELVKEACGPLARQIALGAPYELFLASEPRWPIWLKDKGLLTEVDTFAIGQLTLWHVSSDPIDVSQTETAVIAIPDPETTAYGNLAKQYLDKIGLWDRKMNEKRIILVGSAPQAVAAVKARTAEMAFIPLSMAIKAGGSYTSIPDMVIEQVGGLTAKADDGARKFWAFCRSENATPIWVKWGFVIPDKSQKGKISK